MSTPRISLDRQSSFAWNDFKIACSKSVERVHQAAYDTWCVSKRAGKNVPYHILGLGLTSGSAYVCAKTIAPYLVSLNQVTPGFSDAFLRAIPWFGPFCQSLIGDVGVGGLLSLACVLSSLTGVLVSSTNNSKGSLNWTLLHLALGLSMSPYFLGGLTLSAPLAILLTICQLFLTDISTQKICNGENYWQLAVMGIASTVVMAPVAFQLSLGLSSQVMVARIITMWGYSIMFCSAGTLYMNQNCFFDSGTPLADSCLKNKKDLLTEKLDMEDTGDGTVFGVHQNIIDLVKACKYLLAQGQPMGLKTLLLHGGPGTGKTKTAVAIARELPDADMYEIKPEHLNSSPGGPSSAVKIAALFKQIRNRMEHHKKPVVIFIDEGNTIFRDRKNLSQADANDREEGGKVTALLLGIDMLGEQVNHNMLVIATANHVDALDPSIAQHFFVKAELKAPRKDDCLKILKNTIREDMFRATDLLTLKNALPSLAEKCFNEGLVGREIRGIINSFENKIYARPFESRNFWVEKLTDHIEKFIAEKQQARLRS